MEEQEVPTEGLSEKINEQAEKEKDWSFYIAISTALIAVLAAITSLLAGHHSNEALIEQIKASDQWAFYQAKGIKAAILEERLENLQLNQQEPPAAQQKKLSEYKKQQAEINEKAEEMQKSSRHHDHLHLVFAGGVTLFQVAIAVSAISVLARRPAFWYVGLVLGTIAIAFVIFGSVQWYHGLS